MLAPEWKVWRSYKWYLFSDTLMVCRPNRIKEGYKKKLVIPLDELMLLTGDEVLDRTLTLAPLGVDSEILEARNAAMTDGIVAQGCEKRNALSGESR